MCPRPFARYVETVEQRYHCRTEQIVAQKVGGQIHQYGRIDTFESYFKEEMYGIIGGKQKKRCTHYPPGAEKITENSLIRSPAEQ